MTHGKHHARRAILGGLAAWPLGLTARPAAASQAEALAAAEFADEQNTPHGLSELTRPLLMVNLWAAWCAGCLEELPTIKGLAAGLGSDSIDVLLLSHAMNWRGDLTFVRQARLPFRHWRLASRLPETVVNTVFRIEDGRFGLPQTMVFAGPGRALVDYHEGSRDWTSPDQLRLARGWLDRAT